MKMIDWKKYYEIGGKEQVELIIEQLKLDINQNELCLKKLNIEIERGKQLINEE